MMPATNNELKALGAEVEAELSGDPEALKKAENAARFSAMRLYLQTLFGCYDGQGWVEIRAIQASKPPMRHFFTVGEAIGATGKGVLQETARWASDLNKKGYEIYCGVLPRSSKGGTKRDVSCAGWTWADIDYKIRGEEDAHNILKRIKTEYLPDMVVMSGFGMHFYWRLTSLDDISEDADRRVFEKSLKRWQTHVQPGTDPVTDVSRVLRLPGFFNNKISTDKRMVILSYARQ